MEDKNFTYTKFKNRLKNVYREGWLDLKIPEEYVESVADHIASSISLVIDYNKLYNLNLNVAKVSELILVKELYKAWPNDKEESEKYKNASSMEVARIKTAKIVQEFDLGKEVMDLYDEATKKESEEAKYAVMFTKFESDIQAVMYYEQGLIKMENVLEDIKWFDEDTRNEILNIFEKYPIPCLSWLIFDSRYYKENKLFSKLSNDLINYCINKYELQNNNKNDRG